jgi:SAM-dependent methyltransferase
VEPSAQARKILEESGFNAYESLAGSAFPDKYFDIIVFNQSIEHMPDPTAAIKTAIKSLSDDGVLIISVPNFASNERAVFGNYWRHIDVPRHLFHFYPVTLAYVASCNNLLVKKKVFKFWGHPGSAFRLERDTIGLVAYLHLIVWCFRQIVSILRFDHDGYGQMMSFHFCKKKDVALAT